MENIPIEQMDECRLRAELSSALTANSILNKKVEDLKAEKQTLQKAREREKYTLRQKQKNAQRLDIQIKNLRERQLDLLEENRRLRKANLSFAPNQIKLRADNKKLEEENVKLEEKVQFLDALEAAGVDNWEGYDAAVEILRKE